METAPPTEQGSRELTPQPEVQETTAETKTQEQIWAEEDAKDPAMSGAKRLRLRRERLNQVKGANNTVRS
jgi:hypothetical protein